MYFKYKHACGVYGCKGNNYSPKTEQKAIKAAVSKLKNGQNSYHENSSKIP